MTLIDVDHIANGNNNVAGLLPYYQLSAPLFFRYNSFPLNIQPHDSVGSALDGTGVHYKTWGKEWFDIIFDVLTEDERLYLEVNFGVLVTVRRYSRRLKAWGNFNASLIQPVDLADTNWITWNSGHWEQARYRFKLLTVIP